MTAKILTEHELLKQKIKDIMKPIEANLVGCLWKEPNLYFDYDDLDQKMFKNSVWQFYYAIGKKIAAKSILEIDEMAVEMYIKDYPKVEEAYKKYGGYETIAITIECANTKNTEGYASDFTKWSAMYNMVCDMSINESTVNDVKELNVNEMYDYFNAKINNIFIKADNGIESHKLQDGLDEIIEDADKGLNVGMPIPSPILSEEIGGIMRGQIILVGGLSGTGKTTITIEQMLSAVFEQEEPCVIGLNEQDNVKWKQELLTWVINNKLLKGQNQFFNKKRWRQGHFSNDEKELLHKASKYIKDKMNNNQIILCEFKSYSSQKFIRVIRKYASLGVKNFVLDTFKISADRSNDDSFWLSMQEDMRKFDDLIKSSNLNVTLWVTLQLSKGAALKRYLTADAIGMAKNVIDVASVSLLIRRLHNDEYPDGKYEISVIQPFEGSKTLSSGKEVKLDPNKKYVIIFIEKNRNGESQTYQIVAEQDLGTLQYKEVGICDIPYDL